MIRVTVTGSECTGKSTLARALAEHYGAPLVEEFVRDWVGRTGRSPEVSDVEEIARGQLDRQRRAQADRAAGLLILDTDLVSTLVYSRHYFGGEPDWLVGEVTENHADLYLLAGIDVPWVADGMQRDRGERRPEMHELFRGELARRGVSFVEVTGPPDKRLMTARAAIDDLLESEPNTP